MARFKPIYRATYLEYLNSQRKKFHDIYVYWALRKMETPEAEGLKHEMLEAMQIMIEYYETQIKANRPGKPLDNLPIELPIREIN